MAADLNLTLNGTPVPVYLGENATLALLQATRAEAAADAAAASEAVALAAAGPNYADTAAGLAATSEGETFAVEDGGIVTIYRHDSGPTATELRVLPTTAALASPSGAGMVGFAQPDADAALRDVNDKLDELPLSPEDFRDVGDTDTEAFTKLLAAVTSRGGGVVRLPSATYELDSFTWPDKISVIGAEGATIQPSSSVSSSGTFMSLSGSDGVHIEGVTFADPDDVLSSLANGPRFFGGTTVANLTIKRCIFREMGATSIRVTHGTNCRVEDNLFEAQRPHPKLSDENSADIYFGGDSDGIHIHNNRFIGADSDLWGSREIGILVATGNAAFTFKNVWITGNEGENYRRFGIGVGTEDHTDVDQESTSCWILNNKFKNMGQQGIKTKAGKRFVIQGNEVDGIERICMELPNSHQGAFYIQINPESVVAANRAYGGERVKLWEGQCGTVSSTTIILPESPAGTWTDAEFSATHPDVNAVIGKHLIYDGQLRYIQDYDPDTRTATINAVFSPAPSSGDMVEIWSNPSTGFFWQGLTGVGTIPTWSDTNGGRAAMTATNYAEGFEVGFLFAGPFFNCEHGSLIAHNCATAMRNRTGTGATLRGINFASVQGHYVDYPNPIGTAQLFLDGLIDCSIGRLHLTGATNNLAQIQNTVNLQVGMLGGALEGAGISQTGRSAILLGNTTNTVIGPIKAGGADAGAGQAYGLACTGTNPGLRLIGTDLRGNATAAFNTSAAPPAETIMAGVIVGATLEMTNANTTYQPAAHGDTVLLNVAITNNRTLTLSTTGATEGRRVKIVRTAAATGAFTLNTSGPTDTVALNAGEWAEYEYSSAAAAWLLVASGTV